MSQKSYPEPKIESISNTGLIKIVFSTKMFVSINEMQQVLNQTFSIENKTYNIVDILIDNPSGVVDQRVLNFSTIIVSYTN